MLAALLVLALSVVIGTVAHELSHAFALSVFQVPYSIEWLPDRGDEGLLHMGLSGRWASVSHQTASPNLSLWKLRIAALMPIVLTVPVSLFAFGVLPNPVPESVELYATLAGIGWVACAIPSPADFAIFWHPSQSVAAASTN